MLQFGVHMLWECGFASFIGPDAVGMYEVLLLLIVSRINNKGKADS
jgi:hypothetical protein